MDTKKRAIILDMDETLENGIYQSRYRVGNGLTMILRPHLDELITKLQEAKKQGIDIVLCTTAKNEWVERFLALKPEFRTLFNRMLTRDNENEWKDFSAEQNPVEHEVGQIDYNAVNSKPVTTFGYYSIVFIDNSSTEYQRLKRLFEIAQGKLEKDVTYFSGFGFNGEGIGIQHILVCRKASDQNPEIAQNLEKYLEYERNDPGCQMMCSVIDDFINKDFTPGLTSVDEKYSTEYTAFFKQYKDLESDLRRFGVRARKEIVVNDELHEYLATDKKYPYEGIEVAKPEVDKREQLGKLIQTAQSTQTKLEDAQKLEEDYKKQQPKEI